MDPHPFIVHFPIVCIILAAIFDWVARIERFDYFRHTGFALLVIGAIATIPAAYTGESAAEVAGTIPGITDSLADHEDISTLTLWSSILLAVARIHLTARKRYTGGSRLAHTLLLTACAGLVLWSAYTGGHLVHAFGAGTQPAMQLPENTRKDSD